MEQSPSPDPITPEPAGEAPFTRRAARADRARSGAPRRRNLWILLGAAGLVLVLAAVVIARLDPRLWTTPESVAREAARSFETGAIGAGPWTEPDAVEAEYADLTGPLATVGMDTPAFVEVVGVSDPVDGTATATLRWNWFAPTNTGASTPDWVYESDLDLRKQDLKWQVDFTPAAVHPDLAEGRFAVTTTPAPRGEIRAGDDRVITRDETVVDVGIEPQRVEDLDETIAVVVEHLDVDGEALKGRVEAAEPTHFVPVITLRQSDYLDVAGDIRPVPGTVFRERQQSLSFEREFARALIGTVGEATAEDISTSSGAVQPGDLVGRSGLQEVFEDELGGVDGLTLTVVPLDEEDDSGDSGEGEAADDGPLLELGPQQGPALHTTLDIDVQKAADAAVDASSGPTSLVALRPSTGEVLAVANGGEGDTGTERGLVGAYPPGSVFKIVTTLALLRAGHTPADVLPCTETATVEGRAFTNAEGHATGDFTLAEDFAESCNTSFVTAAVEDLTAQDLADAAADLGMTEPAIGTAARGVEVDTGATGVDLAAASIGQGTVTASALAIAAGSASVAAGTTVTPVLLPDHAGAGGGAEGATGLTADEAEILGALMREVVTAGTGEDLADVPGEPVHGKTGTAEYGTEVPPRTHGWFTGYQGDLAFAVVVEDGGFGSDSAVPVVEEFLRGLAS
ncbi:penicillin-binding transpeptidase domain-containing protein [Brevibacterium litoralis]|uniref:penicillin-binding transpeptidase domain-containing protein n=1 Tax=Brevibacterium litoralis TaxID=3138935 RepID=UPI0032EADE46